ncbi:hypothetical protein BDQ17DRAFT_1407195 [Cyathus striatus]|nr:hypothetical protein BDQ17DRAFT_1407195 [Cyathus striatus]
MSKVARVAKVAKKAAKVAKDGPSHLARVLEQLNAEPSLIVSPKVKSLKVSWAPEGRIASAKVFVKNDLPRIRWANPNLEIKCERLENPKLEARAPTLSLEFVDGTTETLRMGRYSSRLITEKFMDLAGAPTWTKYKSQRIAAGLPIIPQGPETAVEPEKDVKMAPKSKVLSAARKGSGARIPVPQDSLSHKLASASM